MGWEYKPGLYGFDSYKNRAYIKCKPRLKSKKQREKAIPKYQAT